jgi:hypothetical protein
MIKHGKDYSNKVYIGFKQKYPLSLTCGTPIVISRKLYVRFQQVEVEKITKKWSWHLCVIDTIGVNTCPMTAFSSF